MYMYTRVYLYSVYFLGRDWLNNHLWLQVGITAILGGPAAIFLQFHVERNPRSITIGQSTVGDIMLYNNSEVGGQGRQLSPQ